MQLREKLSERAIAKRTGLSRNTGVPPENLHEGRLEIDIVCLQCYIRRGGRWA